MWLRVMSILMVVFMVGAFLSGCTEQQASQIDKTLADANSVTTGVVELVRGPGGAVLPPMVRTLAEILGVSVVTALGIWKQVRHNLTKNALKAVTQGVDKMKDAEAAAVKKEIAEKMKGLAGEKRSVTYAKLNAEIDKAKAS